MKTKHTLLAIGVMGAVLSSAANAEIRFNGFASIVAGQASGDTDSLYGYDDDISLSPESKFALQASADLADGLTATAQIMARGSDDYSAEFEWAYLTYQATDNVRVSAGRMRLPFYRYSDFLDVGFAYPWIRPPKSVYSLSFSTYEGVSVLHDGVIGDWNSSAQLVFGSYDGETNAITSADPSELNNIAGVNWTMNRDWFTARAGYFRGDLTVNTAEPGFTGLTSSLQQLGFGQVASELLIDDDEGSFLALGMGIDYNNFIFDAEYTELRVDNSVISEQDAYYLMAGYRFNEYTVHVTYGNEDEVAAQESLNLLPLTIGGAPLVAPNGVPLQAIVNGAFTASEQDRDEWGFGVRYDFHPMATWKVDYTTREDNLRNIDDSVISTGIDLVF